MYGNTWRMMAVAVAMWTCCVLFAAGGETKQERLQRRLDRLLSEGFLLSSGADSKVSRYQFKYSRRVRVAPRTFSNWTVVVERTGELQAALFVAGDGMPYAYLWSKGMTFPDRERLDKLYTLEGVRLRLAGGNLEDVLNGIGFTNTIDRSEVRLDLTRILRDARAEARKEDVDARNATFRWEKENGSTGILRLTRERRPQASPIGCVILKNKDGEYLALSDILLDEDPWMLLSRPDPTFRALVPEVDPAELMERYGSFAEATGWLLDEGVVSKLTREGRLQAAGAGLCFGILARGQFSRKQLTEMERSLETLQKARKGQVAEDVWLHALESLYGLLHIKVIAAAEVILSDSQGGMRYVTGYDRRRAASIFQTRAGPPFSRKFYETCQNVIASADARPEYRAVLLDVVGMVGVPELSEFFGDLQARLEPEPPPLVRLALASAKARTGTVTDADVQALRNAALDKKTHPRWRLVSLESLLLLDEAEGLESLIEEAVLGHFNGDSDVAWRCKSAAGCAEEGREVLLKLARQRPDAIEFLDLMRTLATAIQPGDRQWESWVELAGRLAADETLDAESRAIAAAVAGREKK